MSPRPTGLQAPGRLWSPVSKSTPTANTAKPEKLSTWTRVGDKPGGTAAGALYVDGHGQRWLVKGYGNNDMAKSEVLASHLLNAAGAPTAELKLVDLGHEHQGGLGVASRWLDHAQAFDVRNHAHVKSMRQAFVAHAWLANWDSVGLLHDNVVIHRGKAVHIDPGGALEYRAMGGKKGGAFAGEVGELETMRDPAMNRASAAVYGSMTKEEIARGASAVLNLPPATIKNLVSRHGPGSSADRMALSAKLIERQRHIKTWCNAAQPGTSRDTGHTLKALDKKFPVYTGAPGGHRVKNIARFVELGTVTEPPRLPEPALNEHDVESYAAHTMAGVAKLPTAQREAILSYAHLGYEEINASLRAGKPSKTAKALDAAIRNAGCEIPPGTLLSRKIKVSGPFKEQLLNATGKVVQEPAVMSTSTKPDMFTGNVHLKLTVGHGVKGLFLGWGSAPGGDSISRMPGESEIVLSPNTRLYIHKVTETRGGGDKDGFGGDGSWMTHIVHALVLPTR